MRPFVHILSLRSTRGGRRPAAALLLVCAVALAGCSSPTAPTTTPPASTPQAPPADPRPALTISCPANITVTASAASGSMVSFTAPAASGGTAPVQVSCTRQSGSLFEVGTTPVQCTATDAAQATASCAFTVTVNAPAPRLSRSRFLAFGDSVTLGEITVPTGAFAADGWPLVRYVVVPSAAYPTRLEAMLRARYTTQATAISVVNSGRGGEWAEDGVRRLPAVLDAVRPEVLLLLHGHNDPTVNGAWLAVDTMAKEGRQRGVRVFIASLPPPRAGGQRALPLSYVTTLNERLRTTAAGEGAVFVDVYAALATDITRNIGIDGLHPTELGYERMASTFADAIRAALEVR